MTITTSARAQYNENTGKASYASGVSKQQATRAACGDCFGTTPASIKVTLDSIVWCPGLDVCCANTADRVTSYGVGWNGEFVLSQGRVLAGFVREMPPLPCWWSAIHWGDFGSAIKYWDANCGGGVRYIYDFVAQNVEVLVAGGNIAVTSELGLRIPGSEYVYTQQIFQKQRSPGKLSGCFDYNEVYDNTRTCPNDCFADGTAVISAWP